MATTRLVACDSTLGLLPVMLQKVLAPLTIGYNGRRTLREVREGAVAKNEVCDAHPELMRVARSSAPETGEQCPLCEEHPLVSVTYVFGPRLPAGGKLALDQVDIDRIATRSGTFASYQVEVCASCGWNHLLRRAVLEGRAN